MEEQKKIYKPEGVCTRKIQYTVKDNKLHNVRFIGGCHGNTQGLSRLLEGMEVDEARKRLTGILCENKGTSCPDQLARALQEED